MITRITGGGESWLYLVIGGLIIDGAHREDEDGMDRLRESLSRLTPLYKD